MEKVTISMVKQLVARYLMVTGHQREVARINIAAS
jgi:hypothetical protein